MTTSLAAQLNALKISQKDALQVPQRVRISFLFDSKQAKNIDDQTLFYICKAGVKQLRDEGLLDLSAFEGDILNEKSLTYYRGTETKETNETIDDQVEALIKALSPHLLEQCALKVIEYLIRIYEVHVFQKQTMLLAFMPLFETVYFLRITQCLNLKEDQVWGWLHEFAYQGQSIDKQTLVKCISRQNGLVFCLCAKYSLEVKGELHTKWFGSFLSEVLKANDNDGMMFNILPFLSQALKQWESRDLRIASFLAFGQIACRRTLTQEYLSAFVRQLLQTLGASDQLEFDEDLKQKGLIALLFFTQYQSVVFDKKQFQALKKINKITKLLGEISKIFDTSSLCRVIIDTDDISVEDLRPVLTPLLNLKSVFMAVQKLVVKGCNNDTPLVRQLLALIRELQPDAFKQSAIFILKQIIDPAQRDKIISLLQDDSDCFKQFGSGSSADYSILSALGSQNKLNRDSALNALVSQDYVNKLNLKEKSLVHLMLLQVLEHNNHDQESLTKLLVIVRHLLDQATDVDYDTLIKLLDLVVSGSLTYNDVITQQIISILCKIKVTRVSNQKSQAWLSIQHAVDLQSDNPYLNLSQIKSVNKNNDDAFVRELMKKPQHAINLLSGLFSEYHNAFDYGQLAKLLRRIGQATQKDIIHSTVVEQLFIPILSFMKKRQFPFINELLSAIVDTGLISDAFNLKLVSKVIGVSLVQKQWNPQQVELQTLHKRLSSDKQKFAELMVRIAISSHCKVKRIFACQVLQAYHQKGKGQFQLQTQLSCKIMIGVVLMLLNDKDRQIRENGIQLAEIVQQMQQRIAKETGIEVIEIFCDTDKPQSAQKKPNKLTPMKSKSVSTLLQDLIDAKSDLTLDKSQLKQVLTKHQKPEVFEEILRTLLDYPTFKLKQCLLQVLTLPQKHAMIFCMNLSQVLQKLFVQVDRQSEQCEDYLRSLGQLISHLQEYAVRQAQKEILTSLSLPFLKYIVDKKVLFDQVYIMLDTNILVSEILKDVDQRVLKEIFKIYIKSAVTSTKIKHLFVQRAAGVYKGDDLAVCLSDTTNQELTLETIIQITSPNSTKLFEQSIVTLEQLIARFVKDEDVAYLIELTSQVALISLPSKDKTAKVKLISNIASKVWAKTQDQVQKGLNQESSKVEDPFDQFMKDDQSNEENEDDDNQVDLLGCLQVTISIMNLLTSLESQDGSISETTNILQQVAEYLVQVCQNKTSTDQSSIKSQLYHLYQSLILRTTKHQNINYSQIIVTFVQSCVKLVDVGAMSKLLIDQGLVMNTVKQVQDYSALIFFTLLWDARQQVEFNDQNLISTNTAALYLAQEMLLWQLDYCQDLKVIQDLMFMVHSIQLDEQSSIIQQQTEILFSQYTCNHLEASQQVVAQFDTKQRRKFVFLVSVLFTQFFDRTPKIISKLGEIAGTETPQQSVQDQLLNILLSSYIIKEQVSQLLITNSNASLLRLQTVIAKWQTSINEIMSLQIHIQLVITILDMPVLSLKINTLCLLIDKLSSFSGGWLAKCQSSIHRVVTKLVQKCVSMLQQQQPESLAQLLLTVLSKTASQSLQKELQTATIEITLQQHKGSLQLQTQAILTEMTLMETYTYQMLDYFHVYLKHTLDGFQTKETMFVDTYKHALLKSLVCITGIFLKFLTADQLEQVITYSIKAAAEGVIITKEQDSVEIVLENIASEAVNHKKLVLQATMNSYSTLFANPLNFGFEKLSERYFTQLLAPVIRRLPQSFISEHQSKFVIFFKQMYGLPVKQPSCTQLLVNCFNAFILKLNEETLRPIVVALSKWSAKESQRKIIFFQIMIGCLNTLREFFVPMVKIYFDTLVATLVECFTALNTQTLTKRTHSATSDAGFELLVVVCKLIEANYKFDSNSFLQNDSFEVLCDPIANLFDLYTLPEFDQFVAQNLKPLILEMDERTLDDNMWQKLNFTLLMKTRSESWQTRLAVLQVIDHLFDKMRERYLVILNDTIPFVSELLEDENEKVELAAKTIVNRIEQLTGESINEYLK